MTRKEYLRFCEGIYRATRGLIQLTPEDRFNFKPKEGLLTVAQVIKHITACLGSSFVQALEGPWPDAPEEEMLPPAERYPKSGSVAEALEEIDRDWQLLQKEIEKITDGEFNQNKLKVPWMPEPMLFVDYMMQAVEHLSNHRMQLFLWLKLAGLDLKTNHLYGMG